jgi:hypothetical protein
MNFRVGDMPLMTRKLTILNFPHSVISTRECRKTVKCNSDNAIAHATPLIQPNLT